MIERPAEEPRVNQFPPPALVAGGGLIYARREVMPDGTPIVQLTIRNPVVAAEAPLDAGSVDALIAKLQEMRLDMPGGLVVASALPGGGA